MKSALLVTIAFVLATPAVSQVRMTGQGFEHLLQLREYEISKDSVAWKTFTPSDCAKCDGKKRVPCNSCKSGEHKFANRCATCKKRKAEPCGRCSGKGIAHDPLVRMPCATCEGQKRVECKLCAGLGVIVVNTDQRPCHGCDRKGGHKCVACGGKGAIPLDNAGARRLEVATRKQLEAARATLLIHLRNLDSEREKLDAAIRNRETEKLAEIHEAAMDAAAKVFPQLSKEPKAVQRIVEGLANKAGSRYFTLGATVTPQQIYRRSVDSAYATLRYQRAAMERCMHRLDADAAKRR